MHLGLPSVPSTKWSGGISGWLGGFLAASISVFPVTCYFVSVFQTAFRGQLISDVADKMVKAYSSAAIATVL